ncbi:hypothetical protein, partial [Serratia nevei]|uniref:hypothetical protein n=1 Tax=Serratia nevei TaxID=2703794 RepID=UPI00254ABF70
RHRSVRLVILVGLAIDQIAQSGLSSLSVIYYSAQLFREAIPHTPVGIFLPPAATVAFPPPYHASATARQRPYRPRRKGLTNCRIY